jgi:hypothetical protein
MDGPENLWIGDFDGDHLIDIVSGEMGTSTGFDDSHSNLFVIFGWDPNGCESGGTANWTEDLP